MVIIEFLGPINKDKIELNISTLKELYQYMSNDKELSSWIDNSAVAVNDQIVTDKNFKLKSGDKVVVLPPVCGG